MHIRVLLTTLVTLFVVSFTASTSATLASPEIPQQTPSDPRAGWIATLSTNSHGVRGTAEIVDARTIRLRNFSYDGGGPRVYAYLGTADTQEAFTIGTIIGPQLNRAEPYVNTTIDLVLPDAASTLDGFSAISIWCADFQVNFGSGSFQAPMSQRTFLPLLAN
jgi:hypothetical protein